MTRAAVLTLGLLVACNGGGTNPPPGPPPPPPTGTLYKLEPSLKPIPSAELNTRPPNPDEFWVGKGESKVLTISAKRLSPLARKVRIEISASGAYLGITPITKTLEGNESVDLTVALDNTINPDTEPVPYFFVYGYPLGENDRALDDQIRVDFRWNLKRPPTPPPAPPPALIR
jgi:hypothetical protein